MSKMQYMFQKKINNGESSLRFVYVGNTNYNNFIYEDRVNIIDNCFDKLMFYRDMERNVSLIRTIFNDFEETNLYVEVITPNYKEIVRYSDKKLAIYNLEHKINLNKYNDTFTLNYVIGRGVNLSFSDDKRKMLVKDVLNQRTKLLTESMEKLYRLTNIKIIELSRDSKQLSEIYKLFYGKVPDFTDKNICTLVQCMFSILYQFGIKLGDKNNYRFDFFIDEKMPICFELNQLIRDLEPYGKVDISFNDSELSIDMKKKIRVIGKCIEEYVNNCDDKINSLINISTILYFNSYNDINNFNNEIVSIFTRYPSKQIENTVKLVKKIDNKITSR